MPEIAITFLTTFFSLAVLKYLLLIYAIGALALPLSFLLFRHTRIFWLAAARILGLLLATYALWLPAHLKLVAFSTRHLWIVLIIAFVLSLIGYARLSKPMLEKCRHYWKPALTGEAIFLLIFAICLLLRMHGGGIHNYEKFMDAAFLNAGIYTETIPPRDPWHFALPINYYYGGYLNMAVLARLAALPPEIAFNLSVCLIVAATALLSYALGFELTRKIRWALLALASVALLSNLHPLLQTIDYWHNLDPTKSFQLDFFQPSRVIADGPPGEEPGYTINEFPLFSFILADLHPHMMALPFVLMFLGLLYQLLNQRARSKQWPGGLRWIALAFILGAFAWINAFDFITFSSVLLLFLGVREWIIRRGCRRPLGFTFKIAGPQILLLALAVLFFHPYFIAYEPPFSGKRFPVGLSDFHSGPGEFLIVWGIQLVAIVTFLIAIWLSLRNRKIDPLLPLAALAVAWMALYILFQSAVSATLPILLVLSAIAFYRTRKTPAFAFASICLIASLLILFLCEWLHIRDRYGDKLQRMNTLFKFYYPCWVMLGLALPVLLRRAWHSLSERRAARWLLVAPAWLLIAAGLQYAVVVSWQQLALYNEETHGPRSLDGLAFMQRNYPGDYNAIRWLRENADSRDVILEATGPPYRYFARISTFSPARAVLGWANHQAIWRGEWPHELEKNVDRIYRSDDLDNVLPLIEKYNIDYICVGALERKIYPAPALDKFHSRFTPAFRDEATNTILYKVPERY